MAKLILIASQMRHGKDTLGNYLIQRLREIDPSDGYDWHSTALASSVKKIYCETFGVDLDFVEKWKVIPECPPGFTKTVRQSLQFIGDGFRSIQPNIWVDLLMRDIKDRSVINDGRYINELRTIHEVGGKVILLLRQEKLNDDPNGSESQIRPLLEWFGATSIEGLVPSDFKIELNRFGVAPKGCEYVDFFICNNGTIEELYEKIDKLIIPHLDLK